MLEKAIEQTGHRPKDIISDKGQQFLHAVPLVPMKVDALREKLALFIVWYNDFRPHQALKGRTPQEVHVNSPPLKMIDLPRNSGLSGFTFKLSYLEGRKHLPVIEIVGKAA